VIVHNSVGDRGFHLFICVAVIGAHQTSEFDVSTLDESPASSPGDGTLSPCSFVRC
jgi:hypothetical protein